MKELGLLIVKKQKSSIDIDKIFNRFYQVDKSRGSHTGNGIGLAIAQQYAEIIKAKIFITDNLPEGSIFHINFEDESGVS